MKALFVDAGYLTALVRRSDQLHRRAVHIQQQHKHDRLITTEFVLTEFANSCARSRLRTLCVSVVRSLRANNLVEIIEASADYFQRGFDSYVQHRDKEWGLSDCISFCVMREYGLKEALSGDHHFEQAGFRTLLRHEPDKSVH